MRADPTSHSPNIATDPKDLGWGSVSDEAKNLIKSLLQKNPDRRPTAVEAKEDPFFKSHFAGTLSKEALQMGDMKSRFEKIMGCVGFGAVPFFHTQALKFSSSLPKQALTPCYRPIPP